MLDLHEWRKNLKRDDEVAYKNYFGELIPGTFQGFQGSLFTTMTELALLRLEPEGYWDWYKLTDVYPREK